MVTCFSDFERSPYNVVKATNPEHLHDLNTDFNHKVEDHWVELIIFYLRTRILRSEWTEFKIFFKNHM